MSGFDEGANIKVLEWSKFMIERKKKIFTFGEIMLRLKSPYGTRFLNESFFESSWAGSEANVAVALARMIKKGLNSVRTNTKNYYCPSFITTLPTNPLTDKCLEELESLGIDTRNIEKETGKNHRFGLFFLEQGVMMRPSKVIYDRKDSAFSNITLNTFDWDIILKEAVWFHISGITPALSEGTRDASIQAVKTAAKLDIPVSVDLNYRESLWDNPAQAQSTIREILPYATYIFGNEEDFVLMVTGEDKPIQITVKKQSEQFKQTAFKVLDLYPKVKGLYSSIRISHSAEHNEWAGACVIKEKVHSEIILSKTHDLKAIVDRVGAGDAFAAGVIYSLLNNFSAQYGIDFAVAAGALKHGIKGDFLRASLQEIKAVAGSDAKGSRIKR